jgi:importin subunit beta-1
MRHQDPRVALQAIEFWSTVSDIEIDIAEETAEALEYGEQPPRQSFNFSQAAVQEIVPVLLWLLTQQDEDADEDDWNPAMAAGTCLSLFAACVGDFIVQHVVGFVEGNIRNADWRFREAAVMAFGCILDGPDSQVLQPLVFQALPVIIEMMQDQVTAVKDTAAWTLGRICELHSSCIRAEMLQSLIGALCNSLLNDSPRVASNCAWAFVNLSEQMGSEFTETPSSSLSQYFAPVVKALLDCSER